MTIKDSAFREYDIRGIVGQEIPIEATYDLARAIATYFVDQLPDLHTVSVAMDGRVSSDAIKELVCKALADSGLHVLFLGLCPTPALYFSLHTTQAQAGIMITASHNPKDYNGLKLCLGKESVAGQQIRTIRDIYRTGTYVRASQKGTVSDYPIHAPYIDWLVKHFGHLKNIKIPMVFDCANATAGTVMPELVKELGWSQATVLYPEIDGTYPHHEADPTLEKNMVDVREILRTTQCQIGFGFDGDADRVGVMTKQGQLVPGDILLALLSKPVLEKHPGATVVCDITSSSALVSAIESWHGRCCMVPTGHASIKKALKREHALLGGELSCHFTFADRYFGFDDGIYAALRLVELVHQSNKTIDQLVSEIPKVFNSPSIRIPCDCSTIPAMIEAIASHYQDMPNVKSLRLDGVRVVTPDGWGLIRASNTQPIINMRFESNTQEGLTRIKQEFAQVLKNYLPIEILRQYLDIA